MKTTKQKFDKNDIIVNTPYCSVGWFFVKETKEKILALGRPQNCKDYMHEALSNVVNNIETNMCCGYNEKSKIHLNKLRIAFYFSDKYLDSCGKKTIIKNLGYIQDYMNTFEIKYGWKKSSIVKMDSNAGLFILLKGSSNYIKSSPALHLYIALIRTLTLAKEDLKKVNLKLVVNCVLTNSERDINFLYKLHCSKKIKVLFKYHNEVYKNLRLTTIFPVRSHQGDFHSSFGIEAFYDDTLLVGKVRKRFKEAIKKEKI